MTSYQNAGEGLKKLFIAAIGSLVCSILTLVPFIGIIFAIGAIVFGIISLIGYYQAGKDIPLCKAAFICIIVDLVLSIGGTFRIIPPIPDFVSTIIGIVAVSLLMLSIIFILRKEGRNETAKKGIIAYVLYMVTFVVSELLGAFLLVGLLFGGLGLTMLFTVISLALSITGLVFQLIFYKDAASEFGCYF